MLPSKKTKVNLWDRNGDYAVFLPSISGFYNTHISKQQQQGDYVPQNRIPTEFENGVEGCNFLNKEQSYFYYPWALYSAGHAQLDVQKSYTEESMVQQRDRANTFILGDSGGFQIGKGVIKFDWDRFFEKKGDADYKGSADGVRNAILNWLEETADYSMILDIPTWAADPVNRDRTKLNGFADALKGTLFNNDYFLANRKGKTKFLNVLQGGNGADADIWYDAVKHYPFEGWAFGGQNMRDAYLMLRRMITLRDEKLLEPGRDVIHFLGTSKLEWAVMLTAVQRNIRKNINPNMTITYDCASPFIATAKGQLYTQHRHDNNCFRYVMTKALDDRRLSGSTVPFAWGSPISERMTIGDVCYYQPGQQNKLGKVSKTSWDSFSYFLMMAHNVYQHIESVQRANALADQASVLAKPDPATWRKVKNGTDEPSQWVPRNVVYMVELVNRVFTSETPMTELDRAANLIGAVNVNANSVSTGAAFNNLFESDKPVMESEDDWGDIDADELLKDIE
jgi:hypothetical protein